MLRLPSTGQICHAITELAPVSVTKTQSDPASIASRISKCRAPLNISINYKLHTGIPVEENIAQKIEHQIRTAT